MQSPFSPPDGGPPSFDYGVANVTIQPLLGNATSTPSEPYLAFFPSGLGVLGLITHLLTHPKIKDWLQLILLGLAAEFTRRLSSYLLIWAREIFCITSVHAPSDESYDWLMCELLLTYARGFPENDCYCSVLDARQEVEGTVSKIVSIIRNHMT